MTATIGAPPDTRHPAKFSAVILAELTGILADEWEYSGKADVCQPLLVLDPFAGVGGIHDLRSSSVFTWGIELEPEWADQHEHTQIGNALDLVDGDGSYDAVVTSPCYGNRMADHHEAKDTSRRNTYRHALGRMPSEDSAAVMQWGDAYREFHIKALWEMDRVLRPEGLLVINISNHIRKGVEQLVTEWWLERMLRLGHNIVEVRPVVTPRLRHGANHEARTANEFILITRKEPS